MDAAQTIRHAIEQVSQLRLARFAEPGLQAATGSVKGFQARRFAGTYADLLGSKDYGPAARFFLEDLYGEKDYSERDAQFSRIAGGLQRLFPQPVIATAVALAELHVLTETLDQRMAKIWMQLFNSTDMQDVSIYVECWASVDDGRERELQLESVLRIGADLDRLTRIPGLRLMLRMMRKPATAAGLGSLQAFLESGFDIFAHMSKGFGSQFFLSTIQARESMLIGMLSGQDKATSVEELRLCLKNTT
jgi:hypothetical protein